MENKNVGYLVLGIAVVIIIIIFLFSNAMEEIVSLSCTAEHGTSCPMYQSINQQKYLSLGIVAVLIMIGFVLIFSKPKERVVVKTKTVEKKAKKIDTSVLEKDEKKVVELLREESGGMFQATLMEKLGIGKVGVTRLLDKLEAKQIVERKRRGMNNIVVLRE